MYKDGKSTPSAKSVSVKLVSEVDYLDMLVPGDHERTIDTAEVASHSQDPFATVLGSGDLITELSVG